MKQIILQQREECSKKKKEQSCRHNVALATKIELK